MPAPIIAPIFDPDRLFRIWNMTEIYTGPSGPGQYVPNVNDAVWDWTGGIYRVVAVNTSTGLSTLVAHSWPTDTGPSEEDVFLTSGPGTVSESFRVYVDKSVIPYTMSIDARLHLYSDSASYVKVFYGTDISVHGEIISAYYNQANILQGENIPLDSIEVPDISNAPIKFPREGYTSKDVHTGDLVTVVAYNDLGQAITRGLFVIEETAYIRQTDAAQKYIVGIGLECPFISNTNSRLIEYPINITLESVPMFGIVTYSDGTHLRLPVDGSKFTMHGLNPYMSTILGQTVPLVLSYVLGPDEANYVTESSFNKTVSVNFEATTIAADGTYSVKLYVTPVWTIPVSGDPYYRLEYYLYNLDRQEFFHVTNLIEVPAGGNVYRPDAFNEMQTLTVAVDLAQVSGLFSEYRHVQIFQLALRLPGDDDSLDVPRWTINYTPGQSPTYGATLLANCSYIDSNYWNVDITCGTESYEEWLTNTYYALKPLFNPASEGPEDIVPNYFFLRSSKRPAELLFPNAFPVSGWDQNFIIDSMDVDNGEVLYIDFVQRVGGTDLQMGTAGIPFYAYYNPGP